jgi:hypothetical protein
VWQQQPVSRPAAPIAHHMGIRCRCTAPAWHRMAWHGTAWHGTHASD